MTRRLVFIGGIHGVGKTQFADLLAKRYGAQHVIASDLIRTRKSLPVHKNVDDVKANQDLLVLALSGLERTSDILLLDGHYCLLSSLCKVEEIPLHTFRQLAPTALIVISDKIDVIRNRLRERDGSNFNRALIKNFQNSEIEHAKKVSVELGVCLEHVVAPGPSEVDDLRWKALFRG